MANKIAILAAKGGVGKTTLSHLMGFGSGLNKKPSYFCATDNQKMMPQESRPYKIIDCREQAALAGFVEQSNILPDQHTFIMDGGANRPQFDLIAANWSDIVLVPHRSSDLDGDECVSDVISFIQNGVDANKIFTVRTQTRANEKRDDFVSEKLKEQGFEIKEFPFEVSQHAALKIVLNKAFKPSDVSSYTRQVAKGLYNVAMRQIELVKRGE